MHLIIIVMHLLNTLCVSDTIQNTLQLWPYNSMRLSHIIDKQNKVYCCSFKPIHTDTCKMYPNSFYSFFKCTLWNNIYGLFFLSLDLFPTVYEGLCTVCRALVTGRRVRHGAARVTWIQVMIRKQLLQQNPLIRSIGGTMFWPVLCHHFYLTRV